MEAGIFIFKEGKHNEPLINNENSDFKKKSHCFICLEGESDIVKLFSCCSVCSAQVHKKCWFSFRRVQKLSVLRSRLLVTNTQDPLTCSVCKTGFAKIDEENNLQWIINKSENKEYLQDELLRTIGSILTNEFTSNDVAVVSSRYIFIFNLVFAVLLIGTVIIMIFVFGLTANYVLLTALFIAYEAIALEVIVYFYYTIGSHSARFCLDPC